MSLMRLDEYIQTYNKITDKKGNLIKFKFNKQQQAIYDVIRKDKENGKPSRIIILKGRQFGVSTFTDCFLVSRIMTRFNTNAMIVAHDSQSTANLYGICKRAYQNLPQELKPMTKYDSMNQLVFDNPDSTGPKGLNSSLRVATAGAEDIGRSLTIHYLHMSEFAFWKKQAEQYLGLIQTVPYDVNTLVVIESTANGYDEFKKIWDKAVAGENDFTPLFFSWLDFEEYQMPYTWFKLTQEEKEFMTTHKCTLEQITWRRYAIETLAGGDIDKFNQEYPTTPQDAFISSGRPYFDTQLISKHLNKCMKGKKGYILNGKIIEDNSSDITFYQEVQEGVPYVLGGDTAGDGSDYNVAWVINNITDEIVCKYRTLDDESIFTETINELGRYYNNALVGLEVNFSTYPTKTLDEKYHYPNLYVRERFDTYQEKYVKAFGFNTTRRTRPLILANLKDYVNNDITKLADEDLLNEMRVFHKDEKGKPQALDGYHDDCIMALAITYWIRDQQTRIKQEPIEIEERPSYSYDSFLSYGG